MTTVDGSTDEKTVARTWSDVGSGEGNKMGSGSDEMGRTQDRGYCRGEGRDQGDTGYEASTGRLMSGQHNLGF
ncbi:hypothetical protein M0R45_016119 [Rubus argutus]|uniref:Uncharacterized protein n=1 Tax=Rubus argutus TaxID=59490 RepID=A0AAW1XSH5_RUBAR